MSTFLKVTSAVWSICLALAYGFGLLPVDLFGRPFAGFSLLQPVSIFTTPKQQAGEDDFITAAQTKDLLLQQKDIYNIMQQQQENCSPK